MTDLVKRLREVGGMSDDGATRWYINPDGPEAASRIEKLEAAVKKVLSQCSWYRTDQWCAGLDCRCIVLVSAMQEELNTSQERVKNNGES